jgi:hypothetical protein
LIFFYIYRFPFVHNPAAETPIPYSEQVTAQADAIAKELSPYWAVHWRTERVEPASNLVGCAHALVDYFNTRAPLMSALHNISATTIDDEDDDDKSTLYNQLQQYQQQQQQQQEQHSNKKRKLVVIMEQILWTQNTTIWSKSWAIDEVQLRKHDSALSAPTFCRIINVSLNHSIMIVYTPLHFFFLYLRTYDDANG